MAATIHHGLFQDLDDETAELINQLLLEDSLQLMNNGHGANVAEPDVQFAVQLVREEAERNQSLLRDHQFAELIGQGVSPDEAGRRFASATTPAGDTAGAENAANEEDGHPLNNDVLAMPSTEENPGAQADVDDRLAAQGAALWGKDESTCSVVGEVDTESITSNSEDIEKEAEVETTRCILCLEYIGVEAVIEAPCGHNYCHACLQEMFNKAFVEEERFPPRCCQAPIPPESVQTALTPEIEVKYQEKKIEFASTNRTYCANSECSVFLVPTTVQKDVAVCNRCQTRTCTLCKAVAHEGNCPDDESTTLLRGLAKSEGWQNCPNCHRVIELTVGCYHMICLCRTHFCYLCQATPWKTCDCPQWDEDRLMNRAAEVVNAQNGGARAAHPPALRDIINMAEQLEGRHNCQHPFFRSLRGSHECQMCHERMPEWVYDCQQCHLQLCRNCRRNRL